MQLDIFASPEQAKVRPDSLAVYDWILVNSSAGKDSLCTLSVVAAEAGAAGVLSRVVTVHADLGRVEWPGTRELAERQAAHFGTRFVAVWRRQGDLLAQVEDRGKWPGPATRFCTAHHKQNQVGRVMTALADSTLDGASGASTPADAPDAPEDQEAPDDLLAHVEERGKWPDSLRRYCTSDHKRGPIRKAMTALVSVTRRSPEEEARMLAAGRPADSLGRCWILSCMGMRADESPARAKRRPFVAESPVESNGRRRVDVWLPLHAWTERRVWQHIDAPGAPEGAGPSLRAAGLVHPAYDKGVPRLSCSFCIFAGRDALLIAGHERPDLLAEYAAVEARIGHRFRQDLSMADVAAAVAAGERPAGRAAGWRM